MLHPAKSKIATKQKSDLLYKAILMLETEEECYNFFQDLCTISEMRSMEQRYAALQGGFGIFLTESWLSSSRSMENELERIRRVYPPKRAETIIRLMYRNFDSLNVIDTGAYPVESILPRTQTLAEQLHLTHRVVPGDSRYLETLLAGPWDAGRFICIPENTVITDADVLLPPVVGRK